LTFSFPTARRTIASATLDIGRRVDNQQMDVIVLAVAFDQFGFEILANLGEDGAKVADSELRQGVAPVFGHKDQVGVESVDDMPSLANVGISAHSVEP
jgi:hypothetical protein